MQIVETTDTCKIYGVNHTADNSIIWQQKAGTPYVLVCILKGDVPDENQLRSILEREEQNIKPDALYTFDGGSIKLCTADHNNTMYRIDQTGVTAGAFAADLKDGELILYGYGKTGIFMNNFCTIRTNVDVSCKKQTFVVKSGGFLGFGKKTVNKQYYEVMVTSRGVYNDGDIYYEINGYKYPIPVSAIGKNFYLDVIENQSVHFGKSKYSTVNLSVPQTYKI